MKNTLIESIMHEVTDYYSNGDNYLNDGEGEELSDREYYEDLFQRAKEQMEEPDQIQESSLYDFENSDQADLTNLDRNGQGFRH